MESNRQKKIAGIVQKDLAEILQNALRDGGTKGVIVSVTKVHVTTDLSIAKVYLSVFPNDHVEVLLREVKELRPTLRNLLAQRVSHQLRHVPELHFYWDDSLTYIDDIDASLKGEEDPIANPDLLRRRKRS